MPTERIESLIRNIQQTLLPEGMTADIERNLRAIVQAYLAKLDLVPREEFDAQKAVLENTRRKLETLEKELERLSAEVGQRKPH